MFRRTNCHFADAGFDRAAGRYDRATSELIGGAAGRVLLDTARARVCVRGPEDRGAADLGYQWLAPADVFPFFELRSAAADLRGGRPFDREDCRRRVAAQVTTPLSLSAL